MSGAGADEKVRGKIFYATHYTKTTGIRWPTPQGGPYAFYTTWNMILGLSVTGITLIAIPWLRIWPATQKIAAFTIVPLAIATIASIFCTAIVSQMLMAFNVNVERPDYEPEEDKKKDLCISIEFTQNMLMYNFIFHMGPLILAILLCLAITFIPAPSTLLGRSAVFLISFLFLTIFCVAWLVTPSKVETSDFDNHYDEETLEESKVQETETAKNKTENEYTGIDKINQIYRDPPSWYMTVVFPMVALLTILFCSYVLYGACMSLGFKGF